MVYETIKSLLFYLDTRQRSGGTLGAPQFSFPNNLVSLRPQNGELIRLTLQEASIEYTFYQIEEFNNKFFVREETTSGSVDRLITIQIGNYNLNTFVVELLNKLNSGPLYLYLITYIPAENRWRFIARPRTDGDTAVSIQWIFDSDLVQLLSGVIIFESANESLGFFENEIVYFDLDAVDNVLTAESSTVITMSPGVENLYVTIQNQCSNYGNANVANTFTSSNILAKIPVSGPPFSTLYFYDLNSNFSTIITNKYLDNLNLILFNERFTQIEPRKNWTFTVKIDIIRPRAEQKTLDAIEELLDLTKLKMVHKSDKK
jgi:hypothetical protein